VIIRKYIQNMHAVHYQIYTLMEAGVWRFH